MSAILKDFGTYKEAISLLFINSDDIKELILGSNYPEEDIDKLMYTYIFPYLYVDRTQDKQLSFICFDIDSPRTRDFLIKDMIVTVCVYCHKGIMKYSREDFCGTRADILADMVDRCLNGSSDFGIGKLKLDSVTSFLEGENYYGRKLIYSVPDFHTKRR